MDFTIKPNIVYVQVDSQNIIIAINSDAFLNNISTEWLYLDEGYGDKYLHAQTNYFDKPLWNEQEIGQYLYLPEQTPHWRERTPEEMSSDVIEYAPVPSQLDVIEAQVTYTAMMTDTLLEG